MVFNPGYRNIENFRGTIQWYMMENKDFISNISFSLNDGNGTLISFKGQSITFTLSTKEVF